MECLVSFTIAGMSLKCLNIELLNEGAVKKVDGR